MNSCLVSKLVHLLKYHGWGHFLHSLEQYVLMSVLDLFANIYLLLTCTVLSDGLHEPSPEDIYALARHTFATIIQFMRRGTSAHR